MEGLNFSVHFMNHHQYVSIYIYIYMCVCVCMYVYTPILLEESQAHVKGGANGSHINSTLEVN